MAALYSWDRGPTESRFVRLLIYPAVGLTGGLVLGFVALFGPRFVARLFHGLPTVLFVGLVVAVVAFAPILWASVRTNRARRKRYRLAREWHDVTRSVPSLLAVLLVGGLLAGAGLRFGWSFEDYLAVSFAGVLVGQALGVVAWFFGSAGEIDPEALTLSYAGRDDVDLRRLRDVKRVSLGRYTVLWLLVSKSNGAGETGVGGIGVRGNAAGENATRQSARTGGPGQDLYAIPTEVVERSWPVFEKGLAAETGEPGGDEADAGTESGRLLRRINVGVALVVLAGGVGVLAFFARFGTPAWQLLQWLWILAGVGFFFGRFLLRTY